MNTMPKISKVSDRIPKFVRDYLNLKDSDELQWDQGAEGNVRFFRLLKRGYNATTGRIDLPIDEEANLKGSDVQINTA